MRSKGAAPANDGLLARHMHLHNITPKPGPRRIATFGVNRMTRNFAMNHLSRNFVRRLVLAVRHDCRGGLSFEWIVLLTVLVLGVVGGMTAVRDAAISELGDVTGAVTAVDQSYRGFGVTFIDPGRERRAGSCRPASREPQ